jgi:hypothetical protein
MGKPKKQTVTTTTNQTSNIDRTNGPAQINESGYRDLFAGAAEAFRTSQAGFNPMEQQAREAALQAAGGNPYEQLFRDAGAAAAGGMTSGRQAAIASGQAAAQGSDTGVRELRRLALSQLNGDFLNPNSNPYLRQSVDAAIDPLNQQFVRQVVPSINDAAIAQGAYGGSRNGIGLGVASGELARETGNIASRMVADNYARERAIQQNSGMLLDQATDMSLNPFRINSEVANQQEGFQDRQMGIYSGLGEFERKTLLDRARILEGLGLGERNLAWGNLGRYAEILGAGGFSRQTGTDVTNGTSVSEQVMPRPGLGGFLQGAAGGASAGASKGPYGALIGGVLGGLGGLFG